VLCPVCGRFKLVFVGMEGTFTVAGNGRLLDKHNKYITGHIHDGRLYCPRCGDMRYNDDIFEKQIRIELLSPK
jgi:uncharacterized Zn finger protein (UPF0148 family)